MKTLKYRLVIKERSGQNESAIFKKNIAAQELSLTW